MRLNEAARLYIPKIEAALRQVLDEKIEEVRRYHPESVSFYENLKEFVLRGGKRLRPLALIMAYKGIREPDDEERLVRVSTCIEFLHNSTLIHDDIIDQDTMRRGGPTFHVMYKRRFSFLPAERSELYGVAFGIVGGDELINIGFEVLASSGYDRERVLKALEHYVKGYREVVHGEILDLLFAASDYEKLTKDDYLLMVTLKTSGLFAHGIAIGLTLAGASQDVVDKMIEYARLISQAFQIQDDILGIFGEEEVIGKPVGSDLREGKATLLVIEGLRRLPPQEKEFLRSLLGRPDITKEDVMKVRKLLTEHGILDEVRGLARRLVAQAKEVLRQAGLREDAREFFEDLADYVIARVK